MRLIKIFIVFATSLFFYNSSAVFAVDLNVCLEIKKKYSTAEDRANAVLECLESLASASDNVTERPPTEKLKFVKPDTYGPTWSTYSSGYRNFEYSKDANGMVYFRGMMNGCPNSMSSVFSLPEGYRPSYRLIFSSMGGPGNAHARVDVTPEGKVYFMWSALTSTCPALSGKSKWWLSLEGISFEGER